MPTARNCAVLVALLATPTVSHAEPDWQIHGRWCTTDRGSSGANYFNVCQHSDQYDSVMACQSHNGGAQAAVAAAGRAAVNAFMEGIKPASCKSSAAPAPAPPAPEPYYVVVRYNCRWASDSSSAGDCTVNQRSSVSCQDAKSKLFKRIDAVGGGCQVCDKQRRNADSGKFIQDGPCRNFQ